MPLSYHVKLCWSACTYWPVVPTHSLILLKVAPPSVDLIRFRLPTITLLASEGSTPKPIAYHPCPPLVFDPFKSRIFVDVSVVVVQLLPPSTDLAIAFIKELEALLLGFANAAYTVLPAQANSVLAPDVPEGKVNKVVAELHVAVVTVAGLFVNR